MFKFSFLHIQLIKDVKYSKSTRLLIKAFPKIILEGLLIFPRLVTHALAFLEIFLFEIDQGGNVIRQLRFAALAASTPIIESSMAMQFTSDFLLN